MDTKALVYTPGNRTFVGSISDLQMLPGFDPPESLEVASHWTGKVLIFALDFTRDDDYYYINGREKLRIILSSK